MDIVKFLTRYVYFEEEADDSWVVGIDYPAIEHDLTEAMHSLYIGESPVNPPKRKDISDIFERAVENYEKELAIKSGTFGR